MLMLRLVEVVVIGASVTGKAVTEVQEMARLA